MSKEPQVKRHKGTNIITEATSADQYQRRKEQEVEIGQSPGRKTPQESTTVPVPVAITAPQAPPSTDFKSRTSQKQVYDLNKVIYSKEALHKTDHKSSIFHSRANLNAILKKKGKITSILGPGFYTVIDRPMPLKSSKHRYRALKLLNDKEQIEETMKITGFKYLSVSSSFFFITNSVAHSLSNIPDIMHALLENISKSLLKILSNSKPSMGTIEAEFKEVFGFTSKERKEIRSLIDLNASNQSVRSGETITSASFDSGLLKAEMILNFMLQLPFYIERSSMDNNLKDCIYLLWMIIMDSFSTKLSKPDLDRLRINCDEFIERLQHEVEGTDQGRIITLNVHMLVHIPDLYLYYGPLINYHTFLSERIMGIFKRSFSGRKAYGKSASLKEVLLRNTMNQIKLINEYDDDEVEDDYLSVDQRQEKYLKKSLDADEEFFLKTAIKQKLLDIQRSDIEKVSETKSVKYLCSDEDMRAIKEFLEDERNMDELVRLIEKDTISHNAPKDNNNQFVLTGSKNVSLMSNAGKSVILRDFKEKIVNKYGELNDLSIRYGFKALDFLTPNGSKEILKPAVPTKKIPAMIRQMRIDKRRLSFHNLEISERFKSIRESVCYIRSYGIERKPFFDQKIKTPKTPAEILRLEQMYRTLSDEELQRRQKDSDLVEIDLEQIDPSVYKSDGFKSFIDNESERSAVFGTAICLHYIEIKDDQYMIARVFNNTQVKRLRLNGGSGRSFQTPFLRLPNIDADDHTRLELVNVKDIVCGAEIKKFSKEKELIFFNTNSAIDRRCTYFGFGKVE